MMILLNDGYMKFFKKHFQVTILTKKSNLNMTKYALLLNMVNDAVEFLKKFG